MQETWLERYGGQISCEWQLAKALQLLEEDPEVYSCMSQFVEVCSRKELAAVPSRFFTILH